MEWKYAIFGVVKLVVLLNFPIEYYKSKILCFFVNVMMNRTHTLREKQLIKIKKI